MTAKPCPVCNKPPDKNEKLKWFWCCNPECQMQDGSFKIDTWNRLYLAPEDCSDPTGRIKELEGRVKLAEAVAFRIHKAIPLPAIIQSVSKFTDKGGPTYMIENEFASRDEVGELLNALHEFSGNCPCPRCEGDKEIETSLPDADNRKHVQILPRRGIQEESNG